MLKTRYLIPLAIFIVMVAFLAVGLKLDPRKVPSPLIDKPAPAFTLPQLDTPDKTFSPKDYIGRVWLLNVWASWCGACRIEHPLLNEFASQHKDVPIVGLNYKDESIAAKRWLQSLGNPYQLSVVDQKGLAGIDWGVYGVPETFLIDANNIIRYKVIGPVTQESIKQELLPRIRQLQQSGG